MHPQVPASPRVFPYAQASLPGGQRYTRKVTPSSALTVSSCPFLNLFSPVPKFPELPNKATQKNLPNK